MTSLKADYRRVRSVSIPPPALPVLMLDTGFLTVISYRFFRAWRRSFLEVRWIRGFFEKAVELMLRTHLPSGLECGPGLVIFHGFGVVVHAQSKLGRNVTLYQRVTIGQRFPGDACPQIGDGVIVGSGAGIFGPVVVPDGARVPANSVVTPKTVDLILKKQVPAA